MYNPYDLHSFSKLYREEALNETQARHRSVRQRTNREPGARRLVELVRGSASWLLRGAWLTEQ